MGSSSYRGIQTMRNWPGCSAKSARKRYVVVEGVSRTISRRGTTWILGMRDPDRLGHRAESGFLQEGRHLLRNLVEDPEAFRDDCGPARDGIFSSGVMAIAFIVLIATMPSAPPSSAATANVAMSWTFGESFGKTGRETASLTARVNSRTASSCWAISVPRPFACGQERLSSIAFTPYVAIFAATLAYSSASLP